MQIAGWVGEHRGIDPGKPGVPEFGRRLYNLSATVSSATALKSRLQTVSRKARVTVESLRSSSLDKVWEKSLSDFCELLYRTPIKGNRF